MDRPARSEYGVGLLVEPECVQGMESAEEGSYRRVPRASVLSRLGLAASMLLAVSVAAAVFLHPRSLARANVTGKHSLIGEAALEETSAPELIHAKEPEFKPLGSNSAPEGSEETPASKKQSQAATTEKTTPAPKTTEEPTTTTIDMSKYESCPATGGDCRDSKCCKDPGTQCFAKNEYWAECRATCEKGMHLTDPDDTLWTCETIGDKTPGEVTEQCSMDGEDCSNTQCCHEPGTQCYGKNEFWAACRRSCTPGPNLMSPEYETWTCEEIGARKPGAGDWVAEKGAQGGQDCSQVGFCAEEGKQCFKKNEGWAECRSECQAGFKENPWDTEWSCDAIGPVTPRSSWPGAPPKGQVAAWVAEKCSGEGENCIDTGCCKSVGWTCMQKNEYWGQCLYQCPPEGAVQADAADAGARRLGAKNTTAAPKDKWDCTVKGPESWGLATKGYPSLYCISLYMPSSYEGAIINVQLNRSAGIFACDGYDLIAADDVIVGTSTDGILVKTLVIPKIEVGVSQDGTAGNAKLFMAMWDAIIAGKRFRDYDWTIKADPDAVLIPWRIRDHMRPHISENVYVVNCNAFPSSPNFPMMYGSVEIFSSAAMIAYAEGSWRCGQDLPWGGWGEDYYMTHCLDYVGVGRISDFSVVGDNVCTGASCADGQASFHPYKTEVEWVKCWDQANGYV